MANEEETPFEIDWQKQPTIRRELIFRVEYDRWHYTYVKVADDGYCELQDWRWGNLKRIPGGYRLSDPEDKKRWDAFQEIWEWLREWEYVELKKIGPEDSEYFATYLLLGVEDSD